MRKILTFFIGAVILGSTHLYADSFSESFKQANQLYRSGKYAEAASSYEILASKYPYQSAVYFNWGNALFRLSKIGPSILAYERAKFLNPRDKDIRYNLGHARGVLEYRVKDKRNWYIQLGEKALSYFTAPEILIVLLVAYGIFIISCLFAVLFRRDLEWGWIRQSLLTVLILSGVLYGAKHTQTHIIRDAIVLAKGADVRYGPSETDQVALHLSEGIKVYVVDHREGWSRVWLINGEGGWMANDQIAEVRLK